MEGKPVTTFLITALVLWAVYLWKHGRLGKPGLLPAPALPRKQEERKPQPGGGWKQGQPGSK
jgi:hypothetical protein